MPLVCLAPQSRTSTRRSSRTARGSVSEVGRRSEAGRLQFTRTQDETNLPSAAKKDMADYLVKLEKQFTLTPQRMRMCVLICYWLFRFRGLELTLPGCRLFGLHRIVDSFIETLERGLTAKGQEVVRSAPRSLPI